MSSLVTQLVLKKKIAWNAGDPDLIPGWGRSPGEWNGNPLQYSCLENPMDRGAWWAEHTFSSIQSLSCVRLSATPWTASLQDSLSITSSLSFLKLMSIESLMPSNQLILCHPLLLFASIFPSIRVCSKESVLFFLLVFHIIECLLVKGHWSFYSRLYFLRIFFITNPGR